MIDKNKINNSSVTSLTLGIISIIIPIIGLVLGVIGIVFSKRSMKEIESTNEDGRGLAIAGSICSIVGIIFQTFVTIGVLNFILAY